MGRHPEDHLAGRSAADRNGLPPWGLERCELRGGLVGATSSSWARLMAPTEPLEEVAAPFSIPAALQMSTEAGGVLVMKVKLRSSKTEISTGIPSPALSWVRALGWLCRPERHPSRLVSRTVSAGGAVTACTGHVAEVQPSRRPMLKAPVGCASRPGKATG